MSESNVSRRQFSQLAAAAFGGLMLGTPQSGRKTGRRKRVFCCGKRGGRVAEGDCSPPAPTDPDVRN